MISKEEFKKRFINDFHNLVGIWDTKENRDKYLKEIDWEDEYKSFVIDLKSDTEYDYTDACISRALNYYYMMYPDY
ncbi:MAG: hypothetical protein Q4E28_01850 [Clostridia bacterium]|nr:hypothetical protein [Clostridia bacterium]